MKERGEVRKLYRNKRALKYCIRFQKESDEKTFRTAKEKPPKLRESHYLTHLKNCGTCGYCLKMKKILTTMKQW